MLLDLCLVPELASLDEEEPWSSFPLLVPLLRPLLVPLDGLVPMHTLKRVEGEASLLLVLGVGEGVDPTTMSPLLLDIIDDDEGGAVVVALGVAVVTVGVDV